MAVMIPQTLEWDTRLSTPICMKLLMVVIKTLPIIRGSTAASIILVALMHNRTTNITSITRLTRTNIITSKTINSSITSLQLVTLMRLYSTEMGQVLM